ncbi:hypothetical protein TSA6c_00485 [Azospirillum sp. TSA6c]|uniref:phage tail length tape measure family protein n=1 Tax=Azospirillum sp. TSA6c TaxID=709813 RepID=UPI000D60D31D|nr:phage tail length tape measure family protein [Azospirillum sp. TSA6c]PWC54376.1 hypothetical protein TSA6c_00485 [Azospirillum sp. TSA6c]
MAADVAFSVGISTEEAKTGRDAIVKWNADIAASYGKVLAAAKDAGAGLNIGGAANANIAGLGGLEKAVNALALSVDKMAQQQDKFIKAAQSVGSASRKAADETAKAAADQIKAWNTAAAEAEGNAAMRIAAEKRATQQFLAEWETQRREREANVRMIMNDEVSAWNTRQKEADANAKMIIAHEKAMADAAKAAVNDKIAAWDAEQRDREATAKMIIAAEEAAARATQEAIAEQDRAAAAYNRLMASIDPVIKQQQQYEAALAKVMDYHRALGSSTEALAADMDKVRDKMSPAAIAARELAKAEETESQALDRITQRMQAAKAAREAQTQATTQQKTAQDALNASVAAGAGGQVSNAGLLATAKAAQDATVSVEKLTKARLDDEAASNALVKSADTLVGKYAPLIKQQQQLAADKEAFTKLQKAGTLSATEEAAILSGLTAKTQVLDAAQKSLAGSMKLSHNNTLALNAAFVNFGQSLAAGMNPLTAFTTQLGQAAPALGEMAIKAGATGSAIAAVAVPVAALAASIVVSIVSYEKYVGSLRDFENALQLTGNAIGMSREQMAAYAETVADAADVSSAFARSTITAYTNLGGISASVMGGLIGLTKDYAAATDQSKDEAAKALGALFSDPAKGVEQLAAKYNMLSGAQLDYVRRLVETGQKTQAQTVLTEALGQRIKGASEETSIWARAWDAVATAASNAATGIGKAIDRAISGPTLEERLNTARTALTALQKQTEKPAAGGVSSVFNVGGDVGGARAREQAQQNVKAAQAEVESLQELIRERNRAAAGQARDAQNNAAGRAALEVTNRYDDLGQSIRKAEGDLATLQKGLGPNMGAAAGQGGKAVEALQNQIADLNKVRGSGLDLATYKSQELAKIDAKYAGQIGPQVAVQIAQEKERINVLGTATTAAQRKAQVDAATSAAQAGVTHAAAEATSQLTLQTQAQERLAAAAGQGEAAQRRATIENQVAAAAVKGLGDATRTALGAQEAATRTQIHADFAGSIKLEVDATERLVAGMQKGAEATRDAQVYNEAYAQTLKEAVPTEADFGKKLADNISLLERKAKALDSKAFEDYNKQLEGQTRQLQLQQKLVGATPQQAARLQSEYDINELLIKQGRNYESLTEGEKKIIDASRDRSIQNAELEQQINRQKDAYETIAQSLEKAFERVGDALVNAFVEGKGSAVDFGNIAKGIVSSLLTDLVKMAAVRPLSNALLGTNYGTIYDLAGGGSAANQNGQSGGMGGAGNLLSLGSKFMPSSWTSSITSAIDGWGMSSLGIGTATAPGMTAAAGGAAQAAGVSAVPGGVTNAATANGAVTGGLTSYLGPLGGGLTAGMLLPSLLGIQNKAAGAAVGGAGGAATGALIGSMIPGVGTLIGALLGGGSGILGGLFGTQKPSVGKTASSDVTINSGGKSATYGNILTDNEGDPEAGKALGNYISSIFTTAATGGGTLAKSFGFGQTAKDGYYIAGSVDYKKFGDDFAAMMRYALIDQGGLKDGGKNTLAAINNSKNKDAEEFGKDVALGASIDAGATALKEFDKTLGGVTRSAKETTADSLKPMLEEFERSKKLGISDAYKGLASDRLKSYLDVLKSPVEWTATEQAVASATGQFQAMREAFVQLDPAIVTTIDAIEKETKARIARDLNKSLDQQTNEAGGKGYVNSINGFLETLNANARSLAAVGEPATKAQDLFNTSLNALLKTLTGSQLDAVSTKFGGDIGALAKTIKAASDATKEFATNISGRLAAALGNTRGSSLIALDAQQAKELKDARDAGLDTTQLVALQGVERAKSAFDLAQQDVMSWYDKEIASKQEYITSLQDGAVKIAEAAKKFKSAFDDIALNDNSPLAPIEKLKEARTQFDTAYGIAKSGTATDTEKQDAQQKLISLGPQLIQIAKSYYASSDSSDYQHVRDVYKEFGDLQALGVDKADESLKTAQSQLKELQKARTDASQIGQRQLGALSDLKSVMDQSYLLWQSALPNIGGGTNTAGTGTKTPPTYVDNRLSRLQAFTNADIESNFGSFSDIIAARAKDPSFNLAEWFKAYGINEVLSGKRSIPGFATGTDYAPGGLAWVGEKGPELMQLPTGSRIYPHSESMGIARSWGAANDRWGGNVMPFRGSRNGGDNGDVVSELKALRAENAKLNNTVEYLCSVIAEGERENIKATKEGNAAAKQSASAAVRRRARG